MDVVSHYSSPSTRLSTVGVSQPGNGHDVRRNSVPGASHTSTRSQDLNFNNPINGETGEKKEEEQQGSKRDSTGPPSSTTFYKPVEIRLNEPVGSMSLSPANRDVVLAAREGLFILDLENPYDQPRFLPHMTVWLPADVQWNPHPFRSNWVASTSNQKLLVWNLDRAAAPRMDPIFSMPVTSGTTSSPSQQAGGMATTGPTQTSSHLTSTLPHPNAYIGASSSISRLSSISHVLHAHTRAITDINWSPFHPEVLASCGIDTWTWSWDLREPSRPKQGYSAWNAAMTQVKWNRASDHRLATSCDNKVLIWDDRKGALPLATIEAHESRIYGIDWSRDTSLGLDRLVTCSLDGSVKFWDLSSDAAQRAIGNRQLVTEPETTIETKTPIWRARNLPFGHGVMTLPQRGDTSLSMWNKESPEEPVHRFEGHKDTVKEYLFRTRGGSDRSHDDRRFQLITWSKDQTLRLWPVSEDMMKAVGHEFGHPIRMIQTRINAPDISYRIPPPHPADPAPPNVISSSPIHSTHLSPTGSSLNVTPGTTSSILPPAGLTRSLLSGSGKASISESSQSYGPKGVTSLYSTSYNAQNQASFSPMEKKMATNSSTYGEQSLSTSLGGRMQQAAFVGLEGARRGKEAAYSKRDSGGMGMEASRPDANSLSLRKQISALELGSDGSKSRQSLRKLDHVDLGRDRPETHNGSDKGKEDHKRREKSRRKKKRQRDQIATSAAAGFMTRGTGSHGGPWRLGLGGPPKLPGTGGGGDAVGWIAGVRMGEQQREATDSNAKEVESVHKSTTGLGSSTHLDPKTKSYDEVLKDAAQVLGEEIMTVSRNITRATFEKIDVSARMCIVNCYGPWAAKHEPSFLRITFTFPKAYPAKAPKYELEHNTSVPLKTRAFLLKTLSRIVAERAAQQVSIAHEGKRDGDGLEGERSGEEIRSGEPTMEACIRFLLGEEVPGGGLQPLSDESEEEEFGYDDDHNLGVRKAPQLPPRLCGASFGPNGLLVVFRPTPAHIESSQSNSRGDVEMNQGAGLGQAESLQSNAGGGTIGAENGGARFLQSYSALSGAMASLARLAREGMDVKDLDVVQLMGDQKFLNRRIHRSGSKTGSRKREYRGTSVAPTKRSIVRSHSRSATRTRSASPVPSRSLRAVPHGPDSGETSQRTTSPHPPAASSRHHPMHATHGSNPYSKLLLWDLSHLLSPLVAPALIKRRTNSLPSSPAPLSPGTPPAVRTPRSEKETSHSASLSVPESLRTTAREQQNSSDDPAPEWVSYSSPEEDGEEEQDDDSDHWDHGPRIQEIKDEDSHASQSDNNDESGSEYGDEDDAERLLRSVESSEMNSTMEAILDLIIWTMPFSFLYLLMDIMIQQQYAMHPTILIELGRLLGTIPLLTIFIWYTTIRSRKDGSPSRRWLQQFAFFLMSVLTGCSFLYTYTESSYDKVVRRTPPLGTLWVFAIVRLELHFAILSLAIVWGFVKTFNLPIWD